MSMRNRERGFSLIEMIVTITILAILAVFISGRMANRSSFDARGHYDALVSATRFAQRYAVTSGCTVRINITASTYAVTTQDAVCGAGNSVQAPHGNAFSGTAPAGVSVTAGAGDYLFDARGDVNTGGNVTVTGGGTTLTFVITPGSGFVNTP